MSDVVRALPKLPKLGEPLTAPPEPVAYIGGSAVICKTADGRYFTGLPTPKGVRPVTPMMDRRTIAMLAMDILAGDSRAQTWPHAIMVMAMAAVLDHIDLAPPPAEAPQHAAEASA